MLSVWKHLEAYRAEEQRLREKLWKNPDTPYENSQELYEEFDVFAVQVKSTVDHLVKVTRFVISRLPVQVGSPAPVPRRKHRFRRH